MKEYQEIRDTSPLGLKMLNDQLRLLWFRVKNTTTKDIRDNAITGEKIQAESIDGKHIKPKSITTGHIKADFAMIEDLQTVNAKIDNLVVNTAMIEDLAVTNAKIANATIEGAKIANATIDTANIALGAITTALIGTGAIETAQIADGSITDAKIVELTANKINAGTLDVERLIIRSAVEPEKSIIYEINNIDGALQSIQGETLNGEILTERTITADKIVANAITANEIASKTITANEIASNAVTADKISVNTLSAITADLGSVTSGTITGATVRTSAGDNRIELSNNLLRSYRSGVRRVQLDYDSLDFYTPDNRLGGEIVATVDSLFDQPTLTLRCNSGMAKIQSRVSSTNYAEMFAIGYLGGDGSAAAGITVLEGNDEGWVEVGPGVVFLDCRHGSKVTTLEVSGSGGVTVYGDFSVDGDIDKIKTGTCTISTSWKSFSFGETLPSVPRMTLTSADGVSSISNGKVRNVTRTGFEAVLGGSGYSASTHHYIAICGEG